MRIIPLTHGYFTFVDDEDYEDLVQYKWLLTHYGYAARGVWDGERRLVTYMHRQIIGAKVGQQVDHRNNNKLDNRRENLRFATHQQNQRNEPKRKLANATSRFKGVKKSPTSRRWKAQISIDNKLLSLGLFESERDAALAYDRAARERHGEFAYLNFPGENLE